MLDSRIIDLSFNKIFLKLILGDEVPLTLATLKVHSVFLILEFGLNRIHPQAR
jgi:E3 ubiquitin-protein ligase TRIP12